MTCKFCGRSEPDLVSLREHILVLMCSPSAPQIMHGSRSDQRTAAVVLEGGEACIMMGAWRLE